ncbi:PREDICTED: endogenous retrovirus group K member 8 Pol protein-like isoform X1 [Chinchilla lanigera]|uniref:endogenous retrovirus group K member 8 Pol protein-like isoform X1 n=1 Tax=Chinchilla lanigera TaxID=34839 RepID=UPI000695D25E|nr:PREDICTED: endogenous retrovirus group K member 8 Pol protein-like isoform X1 [Chinchilla lanigera]
MDDILLSHTDPHQLQLGLQQLLASLNVIGLQIAPDKIQIKPTYTYLGHHISDKIIPVAPKIFRQPSHSLTEVQQLCGVIYWLRPATALSSDRLHPLYDLLQGNPDPTSPRVLSPQAQQTLDYVEQAIQQAQIERHDLNQPILAIVLTTPTMPVGVLRQQGPLMWTHVAYSSLSKITPLLTIICHLGTQLRKLAVLHYGREPDTLPLTNNQLEALLPHNLDLQMLLLHIPGQTSNHYPSSRTLQGLQQLPLMRPSHFPSSTPIPHSRVAFMDASKTTYAIIIHHPHDYNHPKIQLTRHTFSVQVAELLVLQVLQHCPDCSINIFSDSQYVVQICHVIPHAVLKQKDTILDRALKTLQNTLQHRRHPWYIQHIRSHSGLPGPIAQGNQLADSLVSIQAIPTVLSDLLTQAKALHSRFHLSAKAIHQLLPEVPRATCKHPVRSCTTCAPFLPLGPLQPQGVNPRGLCPSARWQMDVTHFLPFGKLKYIHVTKDTFSGATMAMAMTGETAQHVSRALEKAILMLGILWDLKTDNGPCYTSQSFKNTCTKYNITLHHGIPYNPQRQAIIERTHQTLKTLIKKEGELHPQSTPDELLTKALITINLLTLDDKGLSPAHKHWGPLLAPPTPLPLVRWKDPMTQSWQPPAPLLTQG